MSWPEGFKMAGRLSLAGTFHKCAVTQGLDDTWFTWRAERGRWGSEGARDEGVDTSVSLDSSRRAHLSVSPEGETAGLFAAQAKETPGEHGRRACGTGHAQEDLGGGSRDVARRCGPRTEGSSDARPPRIELEGASHRADARGTGRTHDCAEVTGCWLSCRVWAELVGRTMTGPGGWGEGVQGGVQDTGIRLPKGKGVVEMRMSGWLPTDALPASADGFCSQTPLSPLSCLHRLLWGRSSSRGQGRRASSPH